MIRSLILTLALFSTKFAVAQDTAVGIEAIEAHFSNAGIVPSLLTSFDPSAVMSVSYTDVGEIQPGQALSQTRTSTPFLCISRPEALLHVKYTMIVEYRGEANTYRVHHARQLVGQPWHQFHACHGRCRPGRH